MPLLFTLLLLLCHPSYAYVGPGPGLSMLGSALGLLGAIGFALLIVVAYPIRLLILKMRSKRKGDGK
jgi:hypothetical protein